jgi:S-adenosylmethionine:tRNA ribosyltransferase-isomerase
MSLDLAEFDYRLPADRIAQRPARPRDSSRLMILAMQESRHGDPPGSPEAHARFSDLPERLRPGDLLVLNDTRVIAARLRAIKTATGGRAEILLLEPEGAGRWTALARGLGRARIGAKLSFRGGAARPRAEGRLEAEVLGHHEDGRVRLAFSGPDADDPTRAGEAPIPPYIRKGQADADDTRDYQTCFARNPGAVAAPTAGLHFTPRILRALEARGVRQTRVTLHVGWGTFEPLAGMDLDTGKLHAERYEVTPEAAAAVNDAREEGRRVLAVGTTSARVLETVADAGGNIAPGAGTTDLFIRPGHPFRALDGLLTNFHLPRSSLLLLVCALAGRERVLAAYREAVRLGYRFYSYGDAMLIL